MSKDLFQQRMVAEGGTTLDDGYQVWVCATDDEAWAEVRNFVGRDPDVIYHGYDIDKAIKAAMEYQP